MKKIVLTLLSSLTFLSCSIGSDTNYENCGNYALSKMTGYPLECHYSPKEQPTNFKPVIATSQEKLLSLYTALPTGCNNEPAIAIDFTKNYLVALYAGQKPTSGYIIKMTSVVENDCDIVINYYEKAPSGNENTTDVASYPSDYILIPKTEKTIYFNRTQESNDSAIIGSFQNNCQTSNCQQFYQLNDYNILKFLDINHGFENFAQYQYSTTIKRDEYTNFLKLIPKEILNLKGTVKTFGDPAESENGGYYFEWRQGGIITKIYFDGRDSADQTAEIKAFKQALKEKVTLLN